ncbi:hypothetical protein DFA_07630 [Cavenderia fasciculata]|uniref:Transmembrane protein n=1 Tax=Cavenderia fasciculata TaxID=261658 RepID=F4Q2H3_CACFS|nr:uncharacterized protein DFA_07630 [Cavenderia fasciculata]EGG16652.1 hypothetical protein DFA_07630 [Cavenderia fasciculata]|eukprot:XP_004355126.1 hypothetical protein DFA_07630 [Cavenderia fasciculata]
MFIGLILAAFYSILITILSGITLHLSYKCVFNLSVFLRDYGPQLPGYVYWSDFLDMIPPPNKFVGFNLTHTLLFALIICLLAATMKLAPSNSSSSSSSSTSANKQKVVLSFGIQSFIMFFQRFCTTLNTKVLSLCLMKSSICTVLQRLLILSFSLSVNFEKKLAKTVREVIDYSSSAAGTLDDIVVESSPSTSLLQPDETIESTKNTPTLDTSSSAETTMPSQFPKEIVNSLIKELKKDNRSGQHVANTLQFQWFNGFGSSTTRISVLHSSLSEFLAVVTFPLDHSQLFVPPQPVESYLYVVGGECWTCIDNTNNSILRQSKDHIYTPTMNSLALSTQRNCTMLLYSRGLLFFVLPKIILNSGLDFVQSIKFLYTITKLSILEFINSNIEPFYFHFVRITSTSGPDIWNARVESPSSTLVYDGKTYPMPRSGESFTNTRGVGQFPSEQVNVPHV